MRSLHISLNTTHSGCKPSPSISSFTHSLQVFLLLPAHLTPATTTFLQADTQSSPLLCSTCLNHLNLPRLTTLATLWTLKRFLILKTMPNLSTRSNKFNIIVTLHFAQPSDINPYYYGHVTSDTSFTNVGPPLPPCQLNHAFCSPEVISLLIHFALLDEYHFASSLYGVLRTHPLTEVIWMEAFLTIVYPFCNKREPYEEHFALDHFAFGGSQYTPLLRTQKRLSEFFCHSWPFWKVENLISLASLGIGSIVRVSSRKLVEFLSS